MGALQDRLTKLAHFLPVRTDYSLDKMAELYISEIVRLHGIPISIISDRDPGFTSSFGHSTEFQHSIPPADGWTIGKSDSGVGRYAEKLCDRL